MAQQEQDKNKLRDTPSVRDGIPLETERRYRKQIEKCENKPMDIVEECYDKFKDFGENFRREYEQLYFEMWCNLRANQLDPFSKILKENENIVMKNQDELLNLIRENLQQQMQQQMQHAWPSKSLSEALISLEICKEKFKAYEGHKWDLDSKTPLELTRPTRMRFKENRLRYLKAQLEFQNQQLDDVVQENIVLRKHIQDVTQKRIYLMETMTVFRKKFQLIKPEILQLQQKMLEESEN